MGTFPLYFDADAAAPGAFTHGRSASAALNSPNLDNWDMFVREALQNSWDARDRTRSDDGVTFAADYFDLKLENSVYLRRFIFGNGVPPNTGLGDLLNKERIPLLVISDTGTTGLRGPTNAALAKGDSPSDFNSFVRETGRNSSKAIKGGSYGFGKGVFYTASSVRTILTYTRTTDASGDPVSRFIAIASDDSYEKDDLTFTGRHLWGIKETFTNNSTGSVNTFAQPLMGRDADRVAERLNLDLHFTDEQPTGTSIGVIDPAFEVLPRAAMQKIAESLTRWAWPHMVHTPDNEDQLHFKVTCNGERVPIPDPTEDPLLKHFKIAYKSARGVDPSAPKELQPVGTAECAPIRSERPKHLLGQLGIKEISPSVDATHSVIGSMGNTVALFRNPRMVVEYLTGPPDSDGRNYVGVFQAAEDLDRQFGLSEPPAHDSWNYNSLEKEQRVGPTWKSDTRNPVKIAMQTLYKTIRQWGTDPNSGKDSKYDRATRQIASTLGGVLGSIPGTSMSANPEPKNRKSTSSRGLKEKRGTPKVSLVNLLPNGDELYAVFQLSMEMPAGSPPAALGVTVQVETDSGPTHNWNRLGYRPVIESWRFIVATDSLKDLRPSRHAVGTGDSDVVTLTPEHSAAALFVRQQRGLAVSLKITHTQADIQEQ